MPGLPELSSPPAVRQGHNPPAVQERKTVGAKVHLMGRQWGEEGETQGEKAIGEE